MHTTHNLIVIRASAETEFWDDIRLRCRCVMDTVRVSEQDDVLVFNVSCQGDLPWRDELRTDNLQLKREDVLAIETSEEGEVGLWTTILDPNYPAFENVTLADYLSDRIPSSPYTSFDWALGEDVFIENNH